jgi:hypothetical protein
MRTDTITSLRSFYSRRVKNASQWREFAQHSTALFTEWSRRKKTCSLEGAGRIATWKTDLWIMEFVERYEQVCRSLSSSWWRLKSRSHFYRSDRRTKRTNGLEEVVSPVLFNKGDPNYRKQGNKQALNKSRDCDGHIRFTLYRINTSSCSTAISNKKFWKELICLLSLHYITFPVKMISVALKLSTTEERRQDQSCLFRRGDYRIRGHNPENPFWVRDPVKVLGLGIIVPMIFNDTYRMIRPMISFRGIKTDK